ncbi:MAG: hypothetical protein EOO73_07545 [Myxococcales bacterium]|nr:MAG: hypothetical protein EOO73_07545 [Myxococcales bacterium]
MRSRVWTAAAAAACAVACGGNAHGSSTESSDEPSLPAACSALFGLPPSLLVDDFEDGDELLDASVGLHGLWYVENDGTGRQSPPAGERAPRSLVAEPGAPNSDARALHTEASGFRGWGAFVGVRLNAAVRATCTVDASASRGLSLWARGKGRVRVNFATPRTTPSGDGGDCSAPACSDFGAVVTLQDDWTRHELLFEELEQPDWADAADWEPTRLVRLSFWAEQGDLSLWLDDLRFF